MRDSIFYSSIRAFFITVFTILGIFAGLFLFFILIALFSGTASDEGITTHYKEKVLADADWKREVKSSDTPVILQMNMKGVIGLDGLAGSTVRQELIESREGKMKDRLKGILIFLNTPGGTADDANSIYESLKEYKEKFKVPIYIYTEGLCASGGMYIAAAADKIYANDQTLVGSIGVITPPFWNVKKVLDKFEIQSLTLYEGKGKNAMSPFHTWAPDEDKNYKEFIAYYYNHFVNLMVTSRPQIDKEKLINEYGAQIFPAPIALKIGFVDGIGASRDSVLKELAKAAGIEDEKYQVIQLESNEWWSSLISSKSPVISGEVKHKLDLPAEMRPELQNRLLYLHRFN